jgi:Concanavalin A-like lectin/glucanases superfamily
MDIVRVLTAIAACGCTAALAAPALKDDKSPVKPLAHFRFAGNAKNEVKGEAEFELKNTEFKDNALSLNGVYEHNGRADGYRAVCKTPKLDYEKFTAALRFKAEEFGEGKSNLLTGGTLYRWFGLERSRGGNLVVTLNNRDFHKEVDGAALEKGKWVVVACSVDVPARKAVAAVNGKKVAVIDLPKDFKVAVAESKEKDADKVWSFTNYSNGNVFHGLVDELLIYGRALTAEELEKIPLRP